MLHHPQLITFDIFGTVLDWRSGLEQACLKAGRALGEGDFDRIVDAQGVLEQGGYRDYVSITRESLTSAVGLDPARATAVAAGIDAWPLYDDAHLLRDIMRSAPCAAMSNSDRRHGAAIQARLGFVLSDWLCAEDTRVYKPDPDFWHQMARRRGIRPGAGWWHVSAYADYDLTVAGELGLTTVFVERPHARPGPASHRVADLNGLCKLLSERQKAINQPWSSI